MCIGKCRTYPKFPEVRDAGQLSWDHSSADEITSPIWGLGTEAGERFGPWRTWGLWGLRGLSAPSLPGYPPSQGLCSVSNGSATHLSTGPSLPEVSTLFLWLLCHKQGPIIMLQAILCDTTYSILIPESHEFKKRRSPFGGTNIWQSQRVSAGQDPMRFVFKLGRWETFLCCAQFFKSSIRMSVSSLDAFV